MAYAEKVAKILQREIKEAQSGILLQVLLLNMDEQNILIEDTTPLIAKFYDRISQACKQVPDHKIVKTTDPAKVYIVLGKNTKDIKKIAHSIYAHMQEYTDSDFPETYLRCSVGSIKFRQTSEDSNGKVIEFSASKLLSLLEYSMQRSGHPPYHCYEDHPVDIEKIRNGNINLNQLKKSISEGRVKFMYQPVIDRISGDIEYYECLLRAPDIHNKFVSAGEVIADAESKGLINIIDFAVIEMVIGELSRDKDVTLSVNISNMGVLDKNLLKRIEELLQKHDVANRLIIEITETSLNRDFANTQKFINVLHGYGCLFAIDDFGSGFTSFKQMLGLSIDIIKIDGSYIRDMLVNNHSKAFVKALVGLAGELGIKTVAEFVENNKVAQLLVELKIDAMQGNFFAEAMKNRIS